MRKDQTANLLVFVQPQQIGEASNCRRCIHLREFRPWRSPELSRICGPESFRFETVNRATPYSLLQQQNHQQDGH